MYDNLITSDHLEQVVQKIQDTKASKSTTLSGYGITDSYTKTETDNRIQDIVGAAPEALDTLEEIAEALQDGESTAAGLVQTLSQKADKSTTVTNIAYGSKKLTKTINGSTTDVVTINAIKSDLALTKSDVGLSNVDNTSDVNKPVSNATQTALDTKVDKVSGKGLSTNDYTTAEKNKLSGIASNAQVNIIESIKVNNTLLPISSKAVNIIVPTKTSELTNNSNFAVDSNYVHTDNNYTTAEKQKLASKVAELDDNGKVLSSQLPSYVDNVVEYASSANFPTTGESGKIYVDTGANLTYRWTGSTYTEISPSLALGETGSTAYRGDRGKVAYTHATDSNRLTTAKTSGLYKISTTAEGHVASTETATKSDIGLGNVDNTSDLDKPISTATQEALNTKVNVTTSVLKSDEEFTYRQTGDSSLDIDAKYGKLKSIKGHTLVWNQLENGTWQSSYNLVKSGNTYTLSAAAERDTLTMFYSKPFIGGHKYLVKAHFKLNRETSISGNFYLGYFSTTTQWIGSGISGESLRAGIDFKNIVTLATDKSILYLGPYHLGTTDKFATTDTFVISNPQVYDLTLMFGAGSEPATPEEFEIMYPGPYYAYTPGNLINNGKQSEYNLVFNQLFPVQYLSVQISGVVSAFSSSADGSYSVTLSDTTTTVINTTNTISHFFSAGHKYYIKNNSSDLNYCVTRCPMIGDFKNNSQIITISSTFNASDSNNNFRFRILSEAPAGTYTIRPWVVDLTQMFGAGNEPATPEEFEVMFPTDYYPYDAGTEQHFSFPQFKTKIETVGWNVWDEEWENCYWDATGVKAYNVSCIGSSNIIPVLSDTMYYSSLGTITRLIVKFFLVDGTITQSIIWTTGAHKTPVGAVGMVFNTYAVDAVTTYSHDICISLSDASRNGTYEPYWRSELKLGLGDIKVKSHNLWDEEWEVGSIDDSTGANAETSNTFRSKNYIPVKPSTAYYIKRSDYSDNSRVRYYQYDENKNYLGLYDNTNNAAVTFSEKTHYLRFRCVSSGVTYNNDICISLSDPAFNGRYEPYGDGGVISITGGLKSAGTVYDEIVGNKAIKRIGAVDLGSLTWNMAWDSSGQASIFYSSLGSSIGLITTGYVFVDISSVVSNASAATALSEKQMTYRHGTNDRIYVKDSSYSNADSFRAAVTGTTLYYTLANPIEYELYNPINLSYKVDKFGTEKLLSGSTSVIVSSPFRADIEYRTTNVTIDDVYGGSDIIKSVEDVDSRLTTVEKSINGLVTIGSGSPTTIPKNIGDFYIDVTNKVLYFATGNQLISDWNS